MKETRIFLNPGETELNITPPRIAYSAIVQIKSQYDERIRFTFNWVSGHLSIFSSIEGGYYTITHEGQLLPEINQRIIKKERLEKLKKINGHIR